MVLPPDEDDADLLPLDGDDVTVLVEDELLLTDLLLLDGDVVVLLVDLLLDTDPVGLLVTDLLLLEDGLTDLPVDSEDTLLLPDTDLLTLDGDDVTVLVDLELLLTDLLLLDGDDVLTDLLTDLPVDSEDTLLLGDDVSTLLLLTVLSGVEPEFLLVVPFTCRLGVYVSTLLGLGFE